MYARDLTGPGSELGRAGKLTSVTQVTSCYTSCSVVHVGVVRVGRGGDTAYRAASGLYMAV